jgi:methylated-DNA-[protein]-cysteine S-methyltransferase
MELSFKEISSPVGQLKLVASEDALVAVLWENETQGRVRLGEMKKVKKHPILAESQRQLEEYFAGRRETFDLPMKPVVGTGFQRKVWKALCSIPFGETRSYAQIAKKIGSPKASRAVGAANGRNPLSIVVPCHRVVGASGKLTGFAGGLAKKSVLLEHEAR